MKKVFLIFLLIFSLLVINNKEYKCEAKNNDFEKIEKYVLMQKKMASIMMSIFISMET